MTTTFLLIILLSLMTVLSNTMKFHHELHYNHQDIVVLTKSPRYFYNQTERNGECSLNGMCDGQRKCSSEGTCVGTARQQKDENYFYDQTQTKSRCPTSSQYNFAIADYFCNGKRVCKEGQCVGSQR